MTSPSRTIHLYFLRSAGLFAQGALLIAATILFAFGMLDLFTVLAAVALVLTWVVVRPAATRAAMRMEFSESTMATLLNERGERSTKNSEARMTWDRYISWKGRRARARARKEYGIEPDRFDTVNAVVTSVVWVAYFVFISSVLAGA